MPPNEANPDPKNPPKSQAAGQGEPTARPSFCVVGIGASAGGLEALETFFDHTPPDSGLAFVLVQHLDPTHKSILTDLIQRHTQMRVVQAEDGLKVEPNYLYIIPPNRDMTIRHTTLYLTKPDRSHGLRLPIDLFFRSLATDQTEKATGVILSGAGSDGTLGLKAIKEQGGLLMVQEPTLAKYDSMPRSAINTGLVDYILPPAEMVQQLLNHFKLAPFERRAGLASPRSEASDVRHQILALLRGQTGHDFSLYKKNTVNRRLERRMAVQQIEQIADYLAHLRQNPTEVQTLFNELLIGVTSFFRDPEAFATLAKTVIPPLFENRRLDEPIRVWVPACSTGEEAYSLAMLLQEEVASRQRPFKIQLFATDIDEEAIEKARQGLYPANIAVDVSPERLQHFFSGVDGTAYQVSETLRKTVVFATQSVIKDPPFSKLDLISCRNLLIYLEPELQKKVISLFYYALKPGGFLFLGTSETPLELAPFFTPLDRKWKLFQRPESGPNRQTLLDFVTPLWISPELRPLEASDPVPSRVVLEKLLLESFMTPCLVVNAHNEILYIYGRVGQYLEPAAGEVDRWNILRVVRDDLRIPLATVVRQALNQKQETRYEDVHLKLDNATHTLTLRARPLLKPPALQGLVVILFEERPLPLADKSDEAGPQPQVGIRQSERIAELDWELEATKQYLQATVEELESSNEESKSTNEELQSANEELETSQEEAQSINEELVTLNTELENKVNQLSAANSDINNLLTSIDVGLIFLDRRFYIRRFNQAVTQVINLIETDVGRPISDIVSKLAHNDWVQAAQAVFETLVPRQLEIRAQTGRWYLLHIRPYRTLENAIEGVVLTFTDITQQKEVALTIQPAREMAENIIGTVRHPLLVLGSDLRVVLANRAFYRTFNLKPAATQDQFVYDLGNRQWDIPPLRELLEEIIPKKTFFEDFEMTHDFPDLGRKTLHLNARQIKSAGGEQPELILLAIEDTTG